MTSDTRKRGTFGKARVAARRVAASLLAVAWAAMLAAAPSGGAQERSGTDSVPAKRPPSIQDSPGWYPIVDPESLSVLIGRRTNAPVVDKAFRGGARSLDDLGRTICRLLRKSERDSLRLLCIREDEFRDILWREFPQSRPATGLTWEDAWMSLDQRLTSGCHGAIGEYGGKSFEFVRFEVDSVGRYKNFKLHMRLRLVVRDDRGQVVTMRWVRAVAERKGRYKVYSTDD